MIYDVLIVGAGVTGAMLARELSRSKVSVCLLEKENDVAMGASKANSGIIHGGYDPVPGTMKAKMNTLGVELLFEAARELHVPHIRNGSMVCAFSPEEEPLLEELYEQGQVNKTPDLQIISGDQARELEPALSKAVTKVLYVPNAGIICPYSLTIAAVGNAMDNGVELRRGFAVSAIEKKEGIFTVTSAKFFTSPRSSMMRSLPVRLPLRKAQSIRPQSLPLADNALSLSVPFSRESSPGA